MAQLGDGLNGYLDVQDATLRAPRLEAVSNIGIANTDPQHAFSVGSNLYVSTESSDVLAVNGNVLCEGIKMGFLEIIPSYDLAAVSNVGNVTQSTIQFSNATTGFVTTAGVEIGGGTIFSGHILPSADDTYDIGSAEFKIRDMYVSDNSLWIGDDTKLSVTGGELKFRKRNTGVVPKGITDMGGSSSAALTHADVSDINDMKLHHWEAYAKSIDATKTTKDIFTDDAENYETSAIKTFNTSNAMTIGTTKTFVVTVSDGKYYIDGAQQLALTLHRHQTYIFDLSSSTLGDHPFVFQTTNTNDGTTNGTNYDTGITNSGTLRTFVVPADAPATLYYYCTAHPGMGATVSISSEAELIVSGRLESTGILNLPIHTSDPVVGVTGDVYFNTTSAIIRYYNGTGWGNVSNAPPEPTGGTVVITSQDRDTSLTYNLGIDFEDDQDSDTQLTYTLASGTLPTGISLPSAGSSTTSGTLTTVGTFNFTVEATDSGSQSSLQSYQMVVTQPPPAVNSFSGFTRVHADYAGQVMSLTGTDFVGTMSVQFKGADNTMYNGTSFSLTSSTSATITLPALPISKFPYTVRIDGSDTSTTLSSFIKGFTTTGSTTITMPAFTMNYWVMGGGGSGGGSHYCGGGAGYIYYNSTARPAGNTIIRVAPASTQSAVQNGNLAGYDGNTSSAVYGVFAGASGGEGGYGPGDPDAGGSSGGGGAGNGGYGGAGGSAGSNGVNGETYNGGAGMGTASHTTARNHLATALATAYSSGTSVTSGSGGAASTGSNAGGGGGGGVVITFPGISVADVALAGVLFSAGSHTPGQPGVGFGAGGGAIGYGGARGSTGRGASGVVFIWN